MRSFIRLLLFCVLLLAGVSVLHASLPKTRVGNFFPLAAAPCPEVALQVPELRLDNSALYAESVSGSTLWTMFDPEGLESYGLSYPQGWWDPKVRNLQTSPEYRRGFQLGMGQGAVVGTAMTVGVAATVLTSGAAAPVIASVLGEGTTATGLTTVDVSGAAGTVAANTTGNVLTGKPAMQGTTRAALLGMAFGLGGEVIGNCVTAFRAGLASEVGAVESSAARIATAPVAAETPRTGPYGRPII